MRKKYANKENDKNVQNVAREQIQYSEPIKVKTKAKTLRMEEQVPVRQPTATELLQQSYNEMKRLRQQEKQEKINRFKSSMF